MNSEPGPALRESFSTAVISMLPSPTRRAAASHPAISFNLIGASPIHYYSIMIDIAGFSTFAFLQFLPQAPASFIAYS
jgi:hypothetical protein